VTAGGLAVVAAVTLSACGGLGGYRVALGQSTPPGTDLPVLPAGPVVTVPSASQAGNPVAFCQDVETLLTLLPRLVERGSSSATVASTKELIARIRNDAPAQLAAQVSVVVAADQRMVADLTASPPNLGALAAAFQDPSYQAAVQEIGAYAYQHCAGG